MHFRELSAYCIQISQVPQLESRYLWLMMIKRTAVFLIKAEEAIILSSTWTDLTFSQIQKRIHSKYIRYFIDTVFSKYLQNASKKNQPNILNT
jgi:hypothetical protein